MPDDACFKDHVAEYWVTHELGTRVERLVFRKPGTGTYYIEFLSIGGTLFVQGDIYEAAYQVNNGQVLSWWGHCDSHYLGQKLMDVTGHSNSRYEWSEEKARESLVQMKKELEKDVEEEQKWMYEAEVNVDDEEAMTFEAWKQARLDKGGEFKGAEARQYHWQEENPEDNCSSSAEWVSFLQSYGEKIFGEDFWEFAPGIGQITNPIIGIHLMALQLALKQLRERGVKLYEKPEEKK